MSCQHDFELKITSCFLKNHNFDLHIAKIKITVDNLFMGLIGGAGSLCISQVVLRGRVDNVRRALCGSLLVSSVHVIFYPSLVKCEVGVAAIFT